jgi:hypothetical protein
MEYSSTKLILLKIQYNLRISFSNSIHIKNTNRLSQSEGEYYIPHSNRRFLDKNLTYHYYFILCDSYVLSDREKVQLP